MPLHVLLADLLALTRAVYELEHSFHWRTRGANFFAQHALFTKLYEATFANLDGIAEKCLGITGQQDAVAPVEQAKQTAAYLEDMNPSSDPATFVQSALTAELLLMTALDEALKHPEMTQGLSNFLQELADQHETSVYLLKQTAA